MKTIIAYLKWYLFGQWMAPAWSACTRASCWSGSNASFRHMNAFGMDDGKFKRSVAFQLDCGCNTVHLIVTNQGDGADARYSIYGNLISWKVHTGMVALMRERIVYCRQHGLAVVLWLLTDDSGAWVREIAKDFRKFVNDVHAAGLFKHVSTVVLALEANEYLSAAQTAALAQAVRAVYRGKIGIHQTSGRMDYAGIGDIFFGQVQPGTSTEAIRAFVQRAKSATGKPVNMFEMERGPDIARCNAAFDAGAFGVGNW